MRPRPLAQIGMLNEVADRYLRVTAVQFDYTERSQQERRSLLTACCERDATAACDNLRRHIEGAGQALLEGLSFRLADEQK